MIYESVEGNIYSCYGNFRIFLSIVNLYFPAAERCYGVDENLKE